MPSSYAQRRVRSSATRRPVNGGSGASLASMRDQPIRVDAGAQDRVQHVLIRVEQRVVGDPALAPIGALEVDAPLPVLDQAQHLRPELAVDRKEREAHVGLGANRPEVEQLAPLGHVAIGVVAKRERPPAAGALDDRRQRPGGDHVGVEQDHRVRRMPQWGDRLEQRRRRARRRRHQLHLRCQQLALLVVEPAVEQEDRLAVADQPQRVDEPDSAEEVALVGDAVERGAHRGPRSRAASGSRTCHRNRSRRLTRLRSA